MTTFRQIAVFLLMVFGLIVLVFSQSLRADDWNHETTFVMNQPVELPGMLLIPNTKYIFQLVGVAGSRNLVRIYNGDKSKLLTTFETLPDIRLDSDNRSVFTYIETRSGHPNAIRSWFFPDSLNGVEFLYPGSQARKIVAHSYEGAQTDTQSAVIDNLQSVSVNAIMPANNHRGRTNTGRE